MHFVLQGQIDFTFVDHFLQLSIQYPDLHCSHSHIPSRTIGVRFVKKAAKSFGEVTDIMFGSSEPQMWLRTCHAKVPKSLRNDIMMVMNIGELM